MEIPLHVLIVEDSEIDFLMLAQELRRGGYDPVCERVETGEAMSAALDRGAWDVILIDYTLPHFSGIAALELIKRKHIDLPAIIVSGTIDDETAVTAMKAGAHDYIMKDNLPRLIPAIEREIRETKGRQERRRLEKALQETEKKYFNVFQHSPVPMAIASVEEGRLFDVNEQYTRLMEYSQEELIGHTTAELNLWADPEERKRFIQAIKKNHGKIQSYPVSVRTKSGNAIKVLFSADIVEINDATCLLSSAVDITERMKTEEILKTQAHILDRMAEGVSLADEKGFITFTNPAYDAIFGYERGELIGKHVSILNVGSSADNIRLNNEIIQVLKTSGGWSGELNNQKKDGTPVTTHAHISAMEISGKQFWVTVQEDITARKQSEKMLRDSEELYRSLASTEDLMYLVDRDCRHLFLNEGYIRRLGFPKDQIIGRHYGEFHAKKDTRIFTDYVNRVFETGDAYQSEHQNASDGRQFIRTYSPVKDSEGQTTAVTVVSKDITERKHAEEALRKSEELYRSLFENMLNGFAYCRMLFDRANPQDFIYLDVNSAFESLTGLKNVVGKKVSEVIPGLRESDTELFEIYGRVALTGKPERFEKYVKVLEMWFSISVYCPKREYFVALFDVITEHKRREEELRESEERYRSLFEHSMDGIVLAIPDGKTIIANPAAYRMFGYTEEEFTRIDRTDAVDTEDPRLTAALEERARTGIFKGELTCVRRDKTRFPAEVTSIVFRDSACNPKTSMLIRDLSEIKKMERALRESEARFRELFEHMQSGVALYDAVNEGADFLFKDINKAGEKITLLTRDQIIGKSLEELFPGTRRMGLLGALTRVWKTGRPELLPIREYQDQRISLWVENYIYKLPSGEIVVIYEDITAHMQLEQALRRAEENFRHSLDNSPLGVRIATAEGETIYVNQTILDYYGYDSIEELRTMPLKDLYTPESYAESQVRKEKRKKSDNVPSEYEVNIVRKDGEVRKLQVLRKTTLWNGEQQSQVIYQDITVRKQAGEALRRSREQLRALAGRLQAAREEERTQIAREIHDEMGGALTAIKIDFSLLARTTAKVRDKALRDSQKVRMAEMVKLIDAAMQTVRRIATGLRPGILDDLGLTAALEWQAIDFQKRTGIRCEFTSSNESVDLDEIRTTALFRIVQEALTNVARHAQATEVNIRLQETEHGILLEVKDNGAGITEEEIQNPKSLGILGMRERALSFGGCVTITGLPGEGTTVAVESPPAEKRGHDREADG